MLVISLPLVSCHAGVLVPGCISVPSTLLDVTISCVYSSASLQVIFGVNCVIWSHTHQCVCG